MNYIIDRRNSKFKLGVNTVARRPHPLKSSKFMTMILECLYAQSVLTNIIGYLGIEDLARASASCRLLRDEIVSEWNRRLDSLRAETTALGDSVSKRDKVIAYFKCRSLAKKMESEMVRHLSMPFCQGGCRLRDLDPIVIFDDRGSYYYFLRIAYCKTAQKIIDLVFEGFVPTWPLQSVLPNSVVLDIRDIYTRMNWSEMQMQLERDTEYYVTHPRMPGLPMDRDAWFEFRTQSREQRKTVMQNLVVSVMALPSEMTSKPRPLVVTFGRMRGADFALGHSLYDMALARVRPHDAGDGDAMKVIFHSNTIRGGTRENRSIGIIEIRQCESVPERVFANE